MKALHRSMAGGAFGALAAATIAGSVAYACHPTQQTELSTTRAMPGELVRVEANGFDPGTTIEIRWGTKSTADVVLATAPVRAVDPSRAQVRVEVRVPEGIPFGDHYTITAIQQPVNDTRHVTKTFAVGPAEVAGAAPSDAPPVKGPAAAPVAPTATAGNVATTGPSADSSSAAVVAAPGAVPSQPSTPGATAAVSRPVAQPAAALQAVAAPAVEAPGQSSVLPSVASPGAPPTEDLWSGLGQVRAPALLDAPAPLPERDGAAVGMLLLGFGAVTLAGIGLSLGRRRLALAIHR